MDTIKIRYWDADNKCRIVELPSKDFQAFIDQYAVAYDIIVDFKIGG